METDLHAAAILAIVVLTGFIVVKYRTFSEKGFIFRLTTGLVFALLPALVGIMSGFHQCRAGEPLWQWLIPCLGIVLISMFIPQRKIAVCAVTILIVVSIGLTTHFLDIVHSKDYVGNNLGGILGPPNNSFTEPIKAQGLWHSWFTGIYQK